MESLTRAEPARRGDRVPAGRLFDCATSRRGAPLIDFHRFEVFSFDCYGTLVDWEAGILQGLRPVLERHGVSPSDDEILELYGRLEPRAEAGPWVSYRTVLRRVVEGFARELGVELAESELGCLGESLGDWPLFSDTVAALEVLSGRYRLAVVSNVDDDLFEKTRRHLEVPFATVVTATAVRSYKPSPTHFEELLRRLSLERDRVLHVAQSLHHDIAPASRLGFTTVWVNRRAGREGTGATPASDARADLEVRDLTDLVRRVGGVSDSRRDATS